MGKLAVVGIDPGLSTGIACAIGADKARDWRDWWDNAARWSATSVALSLDQREVSGACIEAADLIRNVHADRTVLVVESFNLKRKFVTSSPVVLSPVIFGSVIKHLLADDVGQIYEYNSGQSKQSVTDARLRAYGAWITGADHERDAYRLVIHALRSEWPFSVRKRG